MFYKKTIRYLKTFYREKKFLTDIFIYPLSLLNYLLRRKTIMNSTELGEHWRQSLIDDKGGNWRGGREIFIKSDNENYIRHILKNSSKKYNTILDIGSYDGYFFDSYSSFNQIICADIFKESREFIKNKYDNKFDFVLLNGNDFSNIKSNSIDFVFSIHTLNRVPRNILIKYFNDIDRITSKNSYVFLQVPDCYYHNSLNHNFTFISALKLKRLLPSFKTTIDYTISTISPIIIGEKNENENPDLV